MNNFLIKLSSLIMAMFILMQTHAFAAQVIQVKGTKALLQLDGLAVQPGSEVFAINAQQKRQAVLRIGQVKGDRAVADVTAGVAQPGLLIIIKSSAGAPPAAAGGTAAGAAEAAPPKTYSDSPTRSARSRKPTKGWGVLGGMAMNTMSLTISSQFASETLALKGNSFNVKGFYDWPVSNSFNIRLASGLEPLSVTGASAGGLGLCTTCTLTINYLTFQGDAQLNLTSGANRIWVGGGFGFLLAMSKSVTITGLEPQATNQVLFVGGGMDLKVGSSAYIPIVLEYGIFPFAGVQMSGLYIRSGIGFKF